MTFYFDYIYLSDHDKIYQMMKSNFKPEMQHPSKELFINNISTYPIGCIKIHDDKEIIGFISSEKWNYVNVERFSFNRNTHSAYVSDGKYIFVSWLCVLPGYTKHLLGHLLINLLFESVQADKIETIILLAEHNSKQQRYYEKLGASASLALDNNLVIMSSNYKTTMNIFKEHPLQKHIDFKKFNVII